MSLTFSCVHKSAETTIFKDMNEDEDDPFPAETCLFEETFCVDSVFTLGGQELRIKEVFGADLGVAAQVWDAAVQLSNFLVDGSVELKGKRVIELGAGTGLLGIFTARLGAAVTLTDLPVALPLLSANVSTNAPPGGWASSPCVLPLSWGTDQLNFPSHWDLVLGADIVYLPETFPLLVDTLVHLCHSGTVVLLCSVMRTEHRTQEFYQDHLCSRFNVELLQRDELLNINIYKATLRATVF